MLFFALGVVVPLLLSVFILLLCAERKKKEQVTTVKYAQNTKNRISDAVDSETGLISNDSTNSHQQKITSNGNEARRPHSSSQASQIRELPQPPLATQENVTSVRNSSDFKNRSSSEASVGTPDTKHSSPKGRRLPTPPPEGIINPAEQQDNDIKDDEDMYARVEDAHKKSEPMRLKIKTLDITEGSGDSSFYAKVGEATEDTSLYAQVDDKGVQGEKESNNKAKSADVNKNAGPSTSAEPTSPAQYTAAEYATIDKAKKGASIKRPKTQKEPTAPPIPDRNFDTDDELDEEAATSNEETTQSEANESAKGPMYDKLCVRESLDHIRLRQEVEEERRQRYANLPACINGVEQNPADLYAQIDEVNAEAVYESLSQPGSADGSFQPQNSNNPNGAYTSIGEMAAPSQANGGNNAVDLQSRPARQHHYEQIQRPDTT